MCFCSFHIFQHVSSQFSDDEGDDKRVVRSAKEKRFEALYSIIKTIRNSMKIKDFNKMLSSYEELLKAFDKAKPVIVKEREKDKAEGKSDELAGGRLSQVLRAHPRRDGEVDQRDLGGHRGKEGDEQGEREITWQPEAEAAQVHEGERG